MSWLGWLALAALAVVVCYWLLVVTEGAYLGTRAVTLLYDRYAERYDQIKQFEPGDEALFLGQPLAHWLSTGRPLMLDVATGTGRLPISVLSELEQPIQVIVLDRSGEMLRQAQRKLSGWPEVVFVQHEAEPLPFADGMFDAVTCLEALEFMPSPKRLLAELVRVLQPGGLLVASNRIGWQARLMPGKTLSTPKLRRLLDDLGMLEVQVLPWQVDYDLVTASKVGSNSPGVVRDLTLLLRCPICQASDFEGDSVLVVRCQQCGWQLLRRDNIWQPVPAQTRRKQAGSVAL